MALRARRGYLEAFRRSIETHDVKPAELRLAVADLQTVEMLVEELSSTDPERVLYAMEILESLDKKNLVSPLLLYHDSAEIRVRAVGVLDGAPPQLALRWLPGLRRLLMDPDPEVRMAAVGALANIESVDVAEMVRPLLHEPNARVAMTAAMILSRSTRPDDIAAAEEALQALAGDPRDSAIETRKELASALRHVRDPRFRRLLVALLMDSSTEVAGEALRSVRQMRDADSIFVPSLIALLRHPQLKGRARDLLVECGESVLDALGQFLRETEEDLSVRMGIPGTIARIPSRRSVEILLDALGETEGALRANVIAGLETLRRRNPDFNFRRVPVEALVLKECESLSRYFELYSACCGQDRLAGRLLARALREKTERSVRPGLPAARACLPVEGHRRGAHRRAAGRGLQVARAGVPGQPHAGRSATAGRPDAGEVIRAGSILRKTANRDQVVRDLILDPDPVDLLRCRQLGLGDAVRIAPARAGTTARGTRFASVAVRRGGLVGAPGPEAAGGSGT